MKGFREFVFRGNVIDLAVAVVIGAAFGAVVAAFVKDLLTPLIAAIFGKPDFSGLYVELNGSRLMYGDFFNSLVSFLLVAAAVYFFVIVPMTAYMAYKKLGEMPTAPRTKQCPECLSDIPIGARRCAFCTASMGQRAA